MTKADRNARAVELWLQSRSWRSIAHRLEAEGFGTVSHQYVSRVVKRELQRAWNGIKAATGNPVAFAGSATEAPEIEIVQPPVRMISASSESSGQPDLDPLNTNETRIELNVESFFSARHFIVIGDATGAPHHHSYRINLRLTGSMDEETGFMLGFAEASEILENAIQPYAEAFLNSLDEFGEKQPTTENLAMSILKGTKSQLAPLPCSPSQLTLWESPTKGVTLTAA